MLMDIFCREIHVVIQIAVYPISMEILKLKNVLFVILIVQAALALKSISAFLVFFLIIITHLRRAVLKVYKKQKMLLNEKNNKKKNYFKELENFFQKINKISS